MEFKPFKVGKFLLLERLATGGMAEVYRAKASGAGGFEKQLAVKRILPTYSANEEFQRMFEYEARLSGQLTHSNIAQVYQFEKFNDTYYLSMEYVNGKNLRQFVNKLKKVNIHAPIEFGISVINEVCKGLDYAHKKKDEVTGRPLNIIHRDMSPQNVMLSYEGAIKIVDFGIAKAKDRVDETRSGVIKGKFGYMSPEQANGEPIDHRTDIFSTGIIFWELLTGRRLFASENDMATLKLIQECVVPLPSKINPKIGGALEKIVLKALTKDLKLRYQDAGTFHRDLQDYLNKTYPHYHQKEVSELVQKVFQTEIEQEKRRIEQIYRQSIPYSQGAKVEESKDEDEIDAIEDALTGETTKSEEEENTAITDADAIKWEDPELEEQTGQSSSEEPSEVERTETPSTEKGAPEVTQEEPLFADEESSMPTLSGDVEVESSFQPVQREDTKIPDLQTDASVEVNRNSPLKTAKKTSSDEPSRLKTQTSSEQEEKIELTLKTPVRKREKAPPPPKEEDENKELQLINQLEPPPRNTSKKESSYRPAFEREEYLPKQSKLLPTVAKSGIALIVVYLIFTTVQSGSFMRGIIHFFGLKSHMDVADLSRNTANSDLSNCLVEITSEPPGARITIDGKQESSTPANLTLPCGSSIKAQLTKEGYRTEDRMLTITKDVRNFSVSLKEVPKGILEITPNFRVDVSVDGQRRGSADQQTPLSLEFYAEKPQEITVRLTNSIFGIDQTFKTRIEPGQRKKLEPQLEPSGRTPSSP